jgi:hypothetical protein
MESATSRPARGRARALRALHGALLAVLYGFLAVKAFLEFDQDWDFLAYHLPGALSAFGLTTYTPEPRLVAVNQGFPPLPRIVQGLLVLATGRHSAASGWNAIGCGLAALGLAALFGRRLAWRWLATALLAVPLFVLHLTSGYADLFAGASLALAFAATGELEGARPRRAAALLVAALAAAMFTRYQAWPIAAIVGGAALLRLRALAGGGRLPRGFAASAALAIALAGVAWPARNLARFGNPVYPVEFPLAPGLFPNATIDADSGWLNTPHWLHPVPRPARFAVSVLEANRLRFGESYRWSLDQAAAIDPTRSPHTRMGGWFPLTVAALACGTALAVRARLVSRTALAAFGLSLVSVAFLPQGHELRYWLFVPLCLAIWTARALPAAPRLARHAIRATLLCAALFVLVAVDPFGLDTRTPAELAPRRAVAFWREAAARRDREPRVICGEMPHTLFFAGPTFREFRVIACDPSAPPPLPAE